MPQSYFIQTFGCAQNVSDSERIAAELSSRGMVAAKSVDRAHHVIINTCMIREMAENRVYGAVHNLTKKKLKTGLPEKIIVTGRMVGMAARDKSGKFLKLIRKRMPNVDEFLPIEEVGFDHAPIRTDTQNAWVPISNGCNNFCTFCVVPFTRGREVSRPYDEILHECYQLAKDGYNKITLLGMNVNSYGADLVAGEENIQVLRDINSKYFTNIKLLNQHKNGIKGYKLLDGRVIKPILVKHLNRLRIPTLFPYLLNDISKISGIEQIDFISSNPWDFSDELIEVIARNPKITRSIHLPIQSGSTFTLKRMNRWYTRDDYLELVAKLKAKIKDIKLSTDIIVGFCGETEEEFLDTVDLAKKVGFYKAYIAMYSDRPMTAAHKAFKDDIPQMDEKASLANTGKSNQQTEFAKENGTLISQISISSTKKLQVVDLTDRVNQVLENQEIDNGICTIFLTHTTTGLTTGEIGEGTDEDLLEIMKNIIPRISFRHAHNPSSHAWSHMAASIIGKSLTIPFSDKELILGTWQSVLLLEFDGPRSRNIIASINE